MKCPKKWYFLFYECAIYRIKSKVAYLGQFFADLDEIWYKSRATQAVSTHQISSWSNEKWQRYGTCSVSQGRRGPSNWVSKMNLLKAGGHSFLPRKLIFWYGVAQYIYPKSYYYLYMIKSSVWPRQGPKDDQSVPKYRARLYPTMHILFRSFYEVNIITTENCYCFRRYFLKPESMQFGWIWFISNYFMKRISFKKPLHSAAHALPYSSPWI